MNMSYVKEGRNNVWRRQGWEGMDYSDGADVEGALLCAVEGASDLSSTSNELVKAVVDWPTEYHFSYRRHNLLRSLNFAPGSSILELGCGCGAMTRFLGESVSDVVAVEGSPSRAQIAGERCRDLPNVRIVCDNLMTFDTGRRFDFVTLIGVLEYAPRYISAIDPIVDCLKRAAGFLKPGGILIIAIENQLGLKYFNGSPEDHIGVPYYGLLGLYRHNEPTTLGRVVLQKKLAAAGLPHSHFSYPFPDYKLPQVILSDKAVSTPGFDAAALLAGIASGAAGYDGFHPNWHENMAWRPIIENGLLSQLANSFLILAAVSEDALRRSEMDWLACAYATNRTPAFATETRFTSSSDSISVEKCGLFRDEAVPKVCWFGNRLLHQPDSVCDYIFGRPYLLDLQERMGRGEGVDSVIEWAAPWLEWLMDNATTSEEGDVLPGWLVDAIPQNFIRGVDGVLRRIDDEWRMENPVPLTTVIIRGLVNALGLSPTSGLLSGVSLEGLIVRVAAERGIVLSKAAIERAAEHEGMLRSIVYAGNSDDSKLMFMSSLERPPGNHFSVLLSGYQQRIQEDLTMEINRVKKTVSWRITAPLRGLWNLLSRKNQKAS